MVRTHPTQQTPLPPRPPLPPLPPPLHHHHHHHHPHPPHQKSQTAHPPHHLPLPHHQARPHPRHTTYPPPPPPRPPTQLALDSLASALDAAAATTTTTQPKPVDSKTIRSRPGAMKRKEQVVRSECERFGKNLAIMAAGVAATATAPAAAGEGAVRGPSTWEALRGFIEGTMERKEEFVKKAEEGEEMVL